MKKRKVKTNKIKVKKIKNSKRFKTYRGGASSDKNVEKVAPSIGEAKSAVSPSMLLLPPPPPPPPSFVTPPPPIPPPSSFMPPPPPPPPPSSQKSPKKSLQEKKQIFIPLSKLEGKGRMPHLPYEKQIHSDDRDIIEMKGKEIDDVIKEKLKQSGVLSSSSSSTQRKKTYQRRIKQMKPPTPPQIELSPGGQNLATTYTPTLDIVEDPVRIPVYQNPHMTTKGYFMTPFTYPYSHPLPLSYIPNLKTKKLTKEERDIRRCIKMYPTTYEFLSPILFDILLRINKKDAYADILVVGKLRDELIPFIAISSHETLKSRLLFSDADIYNFMEWINQLQKAKASIGPTPYNIYQPEIPNINVMTPDTTPLDPTSLQVVGYNTHPMFRPLTEADKIELAELSEKNKKIKGEDFVYLMAHGALQAELSPEMKILANKYLRIIEIGKAGNLLTPYSVNFVFDINNFMRNPKNFVMFDNNKEGGKKRKELFDKLCPYMFNDNINLCRKAETFDLIDITHEREFEGHHEDIMIKEDLKITYKTLHNMITMGFFLPINYERDKSTPFKHKKELFRLYPGTTFFSKNTKFKLIETLLPIAIRENKRINILIFSCNVFYPNDDDIYNIPLIHKPGSKNPAINILTLSKRYISNLSKLIADFLMAFQSNNLITGILHTFVNGVDNFTNLTNYAANGKYTELFSISDNIIKFYNSYFLPFTYNNLQIRKIEEMFSFAGIGFNAISNDLILYDQPLKDTDYYSYSNELIKVKIYIMKEMMSILSTRIYLIKALMQNIFSNLIELRDMYGAVPSPANLQTCDMLDNAVYCANKMYRYFDSLTALISYIREGFVNSPSDPDVFISFTFFNKAMKEYNETEAEKIYDELVENMDYDRYEGETVGFGERLYKTSFQNPLPPGKFRKTARFMYKYKKLPDVDDIKERRKTMKQKLQKQLRIGDKARNAKDIHAVSV
jgi:hypothetical protein